MNGIVYNAPEGLHLRKIKTKNNKFTAPVRIGDDEGIYEGLPLNVLEIVEVVTDVTETSVSLTSLRRLALTESDGSPIEVDEVKLSSLLKHVKQYLP